MINHTPDDFRPPIDAQPRKLDMDRRLYMNKIKMMTELMIVGSVSLLGACTVIDDSDPVIEPPVEQRQMVELACEFEHRSDVVGHVRIATVLHGTSTMEACSTGPIGCRVGDVEPFADYVTFTCVRGSMGTATGWRCHAESIPLESLSSGRLGAGDVLNLGHSFIADDRMGITSTGVLRVEDNIYDRRRLTDGVVLRYGVKAEFDQTSQSVVLDGVVDSSSTGGSRVRKTATGSCSNGWTEV